MHSSNNYYDAEGCDLKNLSPDASLWYESPDTPFDDLKSNHFDEFKKEPMNYPSDGWLESSSSSADYNNAPLVPSPADIHHGSHRATPYSRPESTLSASAHRSSANMPVKGRPTKATSNSKMATYARNYREIKKSQMAQCAQQNEELKAENFRLRMDNHELQASLTRLEQEIGHLREAFGRTSSIVSAISSFKPAPDGKSNSPTDIFNGFCLHLADGKFTLEVCQHCSSSSRSKLNPEPSQSEIAPNRAVMKASIGMLADFA